MIEAEAEIKMSGDENEFSKSSEADLQIDDVSEEKSLGEISAPRWSVITFENCAATNLSYREATEKRLELSQQNVAGLCIVTDEAAARISINR